MIERRACKIAFQVPHAREKQLHSIHVVASVLMVNPP